MEVKKVSLLSFLIVLGWFRKSMHGVGSIMGSILPSNNVFVLVY